MNSAAMLPAYAHAKRNSRLAALVSGRPKKLKALRKRYGIELLADYTAADYFSTAATSTPSISPCPMTNIRNGRSVRSAPRRAELTRANRCEASK